MRRFAGDRSWTPSVPPFGLNSDARRKLNEPGIQHLQLILCRIEEYNPHAHSFLDIENLSTRLKRPLIAGNAHIEGRSLRKRVQNVHVTSSEANLRDRSSPLGCLPVSVSSVVAMKEYRGALRLSPDAEAELPGESGDSFKVISS